MKIVIAIGGNMISDASNKSETFEEQQIRVKETAIIIAEIINEGHQVVITHGNGPQVGSLLLQQAERIPGAIKLPLNVLGALTQGQIGVMLQHALINEFANQNISNQVFVVPTTVFVDENDPGFTNPTKPIGPFYTDEEYEGLKADGNHYTRQSKGYRRIVASPVPIDMLESSVIIDLIDKRNLVIAVGGGGSPTIRRDNEIKLVDAVIDKDLASAVLAEKINADMLLILTNVDGVFKNFGSEDQMLLSQITTPQAELLLSGDSLGAGSMKPKVKACLHFAKSGKRAAITSPQNAVKTIKGEAGTTISS